MLSPKLSNIYNCSINKIEKLLKDPNTYKSPGPDGLSPAASWNVNRFSLHLYVHYNL